MQILGRELQVLIIQNLGNGYFGNSLDISGYLTDIGDVGFELDKDLNKTNIGSCSFKCFDNNNIIQSFIQNQLQVSNGIYNPYVLVLLGGVAKFYGVIDPRNIQTNLKSGELEITITAQNWVSMLNKVDLDTNFWRRENPTNGISRPGTTTKVGKASQARIAAGHMGTANNIPYLSIVYFESPNNWFQVNDRFTCDTVAGTFVCVGVKEVENPIPGVLTGMWIEAQLANFQWPNPDGDILYWLTTGLKLLATANFTRLSEETTEQTYFTVTKAVVPDEVNPKYEIELDTVTGLVPGDKLDLRSDLSRPNGATFDIVDVDAEKKRVYTLEPIEKALGINDKLYYSSETLNQLVYGNFRDIISRANTITATDFSRFTPAVLPNPSLSWLPFRVLSGPSSAGSILLSPCDIQPTLDAIEVKGQGTLAWIGSPEDGWSPTTWASKVIWTDQRETVPAYLMPDETSSLSPYTPTRNRNGALRNWKMRRVDDLELGDYDPNENDIPSVTVVHDYSNMNRYVIAKTGSSITCKYRKYNGSAFGAEQTLTWSGAAPLSVVPFKDVACNFEAGYSLLCLDSDNSLSIKYGVNSATLALNENLKTGILKQTPYGTYLVNQKGYGKISYSAGSLSIAYVELIKDRDINLIPTTFTALNQDKIYCLASTIYTNPEDLKKIYEIYSVELSPNPNPEYPAAAITAFEKISDGSPRIAMAFKDPAKNRIIGLVGSRLFQIGNTMSEVVERYSAEGLNAAQLIENVCMIHNAMAIPRPDGVLEIVSRTFSETPANVNVIIESETKSRISEYFFSQVNVSGATEDIWAYANSDNVGGTTYQILDHPFISTTSQCRAIALAYAEYFGHERKMVDQSWTFTGGNIAPWETLNPYQRVIINGIAIEYYIIKLTYSLKDYSCKVTLLEAN